jgi:hypothetical protein
MLTACSSWSRDAVVQKIGCGAAHAAHTVGWEGAGGARWIGEQGIGGGGVLAEKIGDKE